MTNLTIRDVFDLPADIPRCIVQIQDFDDLQTLQENIRDYVITDTVAAEMQRLVDRIVASCVRQGAGEGHYLHGSFGSGKSHFMAILGLILQNNPAIWAKEHPAIVALRQRHGDWLAQHPVLVVPVYMLGQKTLQLACYNAANERLQRLGQPPCEFSDADKVIASFRADAQRYGEVVYQQFAEATGLSRQRFERQATGSQEQRDELARQVLQYRQASRVERAQLYPDKFSDGMAALTRHAQALGYAGVVFLVDELILYLTGKAGREYADEFNSLVALADNSALDRAVPLWVIVAKQRNIRESVPDDSSQQHIFEAMEHHKDRFPQTTELADTELVPIVQERVLRVRPGMDQALHSAIDEALDDLPKEVRDTLLHNLALEDFRRVYPFHPALIRTLIDVTSRLSRERAAIRLLYELLIKCHPDLPLGAFIAYASLFDVVFLPTGLTGDSANEELEAVRKTYYDRLQPLIREAYPDPDSERARRADLLVKTVLLAGLSKTMAGSVTVERILHLNYRDLRARTDFGSYQVIDQMLTDLDNRSELIHYTPNALNPSAGVASITLASGVQLADVLRRVPINWRQRLDAYTGLLKDLLDKPIINSEIPAYERKWRGTARPGRVRFTEIASLSQNEISVQTGHEFTLFVDYPFSLGETHTRNDALQVIERAQARTVDSIGFWLPAEFTLDDRRDLDEYAKMIEVEANQEQYLDEYGKSQREEIIQKLIGQKRTKATILRQRLIEVYKGPDAQVRFLDPAITPMLDVDTLSAALDRIADAVCDRRYPHHPHFTTPLDRRTLTRLLDEFMVPAALGDGAVRRTPDLDALLIRLGKPLELAEQGANTWTLRQQSRYLSKLDELASGRRVETEKIARGLAGAFGFNRELSDTFILYLIKAQGFRALRNEQPVTDVEAGRLSGLVLERGQRLAVYEWTQAKELIQKTWVQPQSAELTIAAQDRLWNQLNAVARSARQQLDDARALLVKALETAGAAPQGLRLAVLDAARALNGLALRSDLDAYEGLRALLAWRPGDSQVTAEQAAVQVAQRDRALNALRDLQTDTLGHIRTLAEGGNPSAQAALVKVQSFLAAANEQADLQSHVLSWEQEAKAVIDSIIKQRAASDRAGNGGGPEIAPETKSATGSVGEGKPALAGRILAAELEVAGETIPLNAQQVEQALGVSVDKLETLASGAQVTVTLRIQLATPD